MTPESLLFAASGIGLRAPHAEDILARRPAVGFLEAHSENYFRIGGGPFDNLMRCREHYPVSLHGVGLSLGSAGGISAAHLCKLKTLVELVDPVLVSEHIAWSGTPEAAVPDLLPLPMSEEALRATAENVDRVQQALGRKILVENPSCYVRFPDGGMTEPEFIAALVRDTGCGLLLDVNNIAVSAHNLGFDPLRYIQSLPPDIVGEMHLAGYQVNRLGDAEVYIDAHNHPVYDTVWDLYAAALAHFGDVPTLLEWDSDLPGLETLVAEAAKADACRRRAREGRRHAKTA